MIAKVMQTSPNDRKWWLNEFCYVWKDGISQGFTKRPLEFKLGAPTAGMQFRSFKCVQSCDHFGWCILVLLLTMAKIHDYIFLYVHTVPSYQRLREICNGIPKTTTLECGVCMRLFFFFSSIAFSLIRHLLTGFG